MRIPALLECLYLNIFSISENASSLSWMPTVHPAIFNIATRLKVVINDKIALVLVVTSPFCSEDSAPDYFLPQKNGYHDAKNYLEMYYNTYFSTQPTFKMIFIDILVSLVHFICLCV